MSRKTFLIGLLFFLTSCELIIIDTFYRQEDSFYAVAFEYLEESYYDSLGQNEGGYYGGGVNEEDEFFEGDDASGADESITKLNDLNPNRQEISFPEQLIDAYVSSSCNDYEGFLKDAIYFEAIEDENSSVGDINNPLFLKTIKITRLDDSRYFATPDKVFRDILTGEIIIQMSIYKSESESTDPVTVTNLIIKDSFGELTIKETFLVETIDYNEDGLIDEIDKIELIEEGIINENDKELNLILIEKGSICTIAPKKPEPKPKRTQPRVLDSDNDGIQDSIDNCPNKFGSISGGGCPDKDGDGIIDSKDRCPANSGSEKFSGCPDSDGDGIPDYNDNCSYEPGTIKNKGCPEPEAPANTEVPFAIVDQVPSFPSCQNRFNSNEKLRECFNKQIQKHISRNFRYPEIAQEMGIQGRVFVTFIIDEYGEVKNIRTRGPDQNLQNEAYRIIQKLPKMQPGIHKGIAVSVPYSIPITFKLR